MGNPPWHPEAAGSGRARFSVSEEEKSHGRSKLRLPPSLHPSLPLKLLLLLWSSFLRGSRHSCSPLHPDATSLGALDQRLRPLEPDLSREKAQGRADVCARVCGQGRRGETLDYASHPLPYSTPEAPGVGGGCPTQNEEGPRKGSCSQHPLSPLAETFHKEGRL